MLQATETIRTVQLARLRRRAPLRPPREIDFKRLLGVQAWAALPLAVRERFDLASHRRAHAYKGTMETVRASLAGLLFANLCRLIGTPLAPYTGTDVPLTVSVHADGRGGLAWDRAYDFPGRPRLQVSSSKILNARGGLAEVVRGGLGMDLALSVEDGALHFRSVRYFLVIGRARLPIPTLLTPGEAHVIHADAGEGRFRFTLRFVHPWLGETMFQTGLFGEV